MFYSKELAPQIPFYEPTLRPKKDKNATFKKCGSFYKLRQFWPSKNIVEIANKIGKNCIFIGIVTKILFLCPNRIDLFIFQQIHDIAKLAPKIEHKTLLYNFKAKLHVVFEKTSWLCKSNSKPNKQTKRRLNFCYV